MCKYKTFSSLQKVILDSIALEQVGVGAVSINILEKKKQERMEVKIIKDILKWMKGVESLDPTHPPMFGNKDLPSSQRGKEVGRLGESG